MIKILVKLSSVLILLFISGCSQQKKIAYLQNIDAVSGLEAMKFEPKIQPDDLLMIIVSAPDPEAAAPFNLTTESVATPLNQTASNGQKQHMLYLVDKEGNIEFPVLGKLNLLNKTKSQFVNELKLNLGKYIKNPIVNLRITNFKVSINGEVTRPGVYPVSSERLTILEALAYAGDLTIYGKRENILVIREQDGNKIIGRIDLTKSDFIKSPFYYLTQNDIIYVEPNGAKSNSSTFNQNIPVWISLSSVLISLVLLFKK